MARAKPKGEPKAGTTQFLSLRAFQQAPTCVSVRCLPPWGKAPRPAKLLLCTNSGPPRPARRASAWPEEAECKASTSRPVSQVMVACGSHGWEPRWFSKLARRLSAFHPSIPSLLPACNTDIMPGRGNHFVAVRMKTIH